MALSKPLPNEQFPSECHLCEVSLDIKWKCIQCDLLMCNTCRVKIHPKIKTGGEHRIIDLKDIGGEESRKQIDFTTIQCDKHEDQTCCLFCTTCDTLICLNCVTKSHSKHEMVQIKEEYEKRKVEIKENHELLQKQRENLLTEKENLKEILKAENENHDKIKKEILVQNTALKTAADQYTEKLIKELDHTMRSIQVSVADEEGKIGPWIIELEKMIDKSENAITTPEVIKFFEEYRIVKKSMKQIVQWINLKIGKLPKFFPGEITSATVGCLIQEITFKTINQFTTEFNKIDFLHATVNNSIWISNIYTGKLQHIKTEQGKLRTINDLYLTVYDMGITANGDILLSVNQSNILQYDQGTGIVRLTQYRVPSNLQTGPLHLTNDNRVIVGARNNHQAVVVVMDYNGKHQITFEFDQNGKPLFTYPKSITTCNGNIWVADNTTDEEKQKGTLTVLSPRGDVEYVYNGHSKKDVLNSPFFPTYLVTTAMNNVIVADPKNGLHILNQSSQLIKFVVASEIGIKLPCCLHYSKSEKLYVGTSTTKVSLEKAKLYEMELKGC